MAEVGSAAAEAAEEGPHKALILDDTLDVILSYLDSESWKVARLVCRAWNDRALANFSKDRRLRLGLSEMADLDSILTSVDPRLLSSLCVDLPLRLEGSERLRVLQDLFGQLRASGNLGELRALKIFELDRKSFGFVIEVFNDGGFEVLRELALRVDFGEAKDERYDCKNLLNPDALPGLRLLCLAARRNGYWNFSSTDLTLFRAGALPAFQSLLSSAPNLDSLDLNMALDLSSSDREVRKLVLTQCDLLSAEEMAGILAAVSSGLRSLSICGESSTIQLPAFPSLTSLSYCHCDSECGTVFLEAANINPTTLPLLRKLQAPFNLIDWTELPSLLPPTASLRDLKVMDFELPSGESVPLALLLNSELTTLSLSFLGRTCPSEFLQTLRLVELEEKKGQRGRVLLEFNGLRDEMQKKCHLSCEEEEPLFLQQALGQFDLRDEGIERVRTRQFTFLLEKLGSSWGLLRLTDYKFLIKPTWKEIQVPLFGGLREGLIRVVPHKGRWYECLDVELQLKE